MRDLQFASRHTPARLPMHTYVFCTLDLLSDTYKPTSAPNSSASASDKDVNRKAYLLGPSSTLSFECFYICIFRSILSRLSSIYIQKGTCSTREKVSCTVLYTLGLRKIRSCVCIRYFRSFYIVNFDNIYFLTTTLKQ